MKRLLVSLLILVVLVTTLIIIFNNQNNTNTEEGKIQIVATVFPVYDFAREIAGDKATVTMLLSPGVEIHDYEPTPQDIITIEEADVFLYLGEDLEPWAETVISGIDNKENLKNVADGISLIKTEEFEENHDIEEVSEEHEEHGEYDTHIWLDPTKSIEIVENIVENLCQADPENSDYYKQRAENYIKELEQLDKEFENTIENGTKSEIAFGGPFSYAYFVERYNLDFVSAYDSCGEESEPSVNKISEVIEEIKANNLPVVFSKELSSGNIAKTISEETGAQILEFHSLHTISNTDLENGETYLSIMKKNLENLKIALDIVEAQ